MSGYAVAAAGLIGFGLTAYLLFGGADFGAGLWHLMSPQQRHRRVIERAMGPIWEANHVWLIFTMVLTWTAFPPVFAAVMSEYWVPLSAAALGIVGRGAAFAFVKAIPGHHGYGMVFGLTSVATPFFFGTVAGGLATGASWLSPTGAFAGLLAVALCAYLAATYLSWDARRLADDAVADHFRAMGLGAGFVTGGIALLGTLALPTFSSAVPATLGGTVADTPAVAVPGPLVLASAVAGLASLALLAARRYLVVRITAALAVATVLWGAAPGVAERLDLAGAAALDQVLVTIFAALGVGGLVLVPSLVWLYTLFQRGTTAESAALTAAAGQPDTEQADRTADDRQQRRDLA